jgi:hypothetical protein
MRHLRLIVAIGLTVGIGGGATSSPAQHPRPKPQPSDTSAPGAFSGKVVFHQAGGSLTYRVRVASGKVVGGQQDFGDRDKPFAAIVGGWFDLDEQKLCLLIQADESLGKKWRAQAQHFRVDEVRRALTLEHALYGYGIDDQRDAIVRDHVLDALEPIRPTPQLPGERAERAEDWMPVVGGAPR